MAEESRTVDMNEPDVLTEDVFRQLYRYKPPPETTVLKKIRKKVACTPSVVANLFPIVKWLPKYNIKTDTVGDLIAGLTVAVMHIPHGLAYAPLAGQPPVVGLYMAVFPTLIYLFLGTSRHLSFGTFAIIMMMTGKTVSEHTSSVFYLNGTVTEDTGGYSTMEVGIAVCFLVGLLQFLMGLLQLGAIWILLSDSLVSGFTAAAACHVIIFQIPNLLGVKVARFSGPLKLVYFIIDLCRHVPETNLVTMGISICAITLLSTFNEQGKPFMKRKFPNCKVPIPMELIIVILGIVTSYFLDLNASYQVKIVNDVPRGLPYPVVPPVDLIPAIFVDCFVIAVVGISMSLSLASIFAKKGNYEIQTNQELIAYGACNMFASFFHCAPSAASLSRSLVQSTIGGKSQIASVFTMITMVLILLFLGGLFEPVPFCVLSSIVVVTLKGLLWQVKDIPGIWRLSKLDGMVWIICFSSVVLLDLDYGLGIGLIVSVLTLVLRNQQPHVLKLGRVPDTNLFIDVDSYKGLSMDSDILILKVVGSIHFANISMVQKKVWTEYKAFLLSRGISETKGAKFIVLDLSCVPSVDPTAANGLTGLYKDFKADCTVLYLAECNNDVYNYLDHCKVFKDLPKTNVIFSVFDAIEFLNSSRNK